MSSVEAIYSGGVFRPLGDVAIAENQRVRLLIEPAPAVDPCDWLRAVEEHQASIIARHGVLPDSTAEIADERRRHE